MFELVPETRSAEFFGFFGFFGKVAALLGPLVTQCGSVEVGIFAISLLIVAGAILLRKSTSKTVSPSQKQRMKEIVQVQG